MPAISPADQETAERLGAALSWVEETLAVIQSFEPAGVGARNLAECLAIQLREQNRYDPAMAKLLAHLELLAAHDFTRPAPALRGRPGRPDGMVAEVRALNPKPGLRFGSSRVEAIVPDILIVQTAQGWQVQLNPDTLPRISVNISYHARSSRSAKSEKDNHPRAA